MKWLRLVRTIRFQWGEIRFGVFLAAVLGLALSPRYLPLLIPEEVLAAPTPESTPATAARPPASPSAPPAIALAESNKQYPPPGQVALLSGQEALTDVLPDGYSAPGT